MSQRNPSAKEVRGADSIEPITNVVVMGGGTAGWMTAAALARYIDKRQCKIIVVESSEIGTIGVGEATIPPIRKYHKSLDIDENELIRAAGATVKLGIEFANWYRIGNQYVHPFGSLGKEINGIGFHQVFFRLEKENLAEEIWRYSPCAVAGLRGRFGQPSQAITLPSGGFPFAFHLDAKLYAQFLRKYAEQHGVERVGATITDFSVCESNGFLESIKTTDGQVIYGDLFIDCSGSRGFLIERAMGIKYLDWIGYLPCNRAVVAPSRNLGPPPLFTRSTAKTAGWQWRIQLQHRTGNGYVYSAAHSSDESAEQELQQSLGPNILDTPRLLSFTAGRRLRFWERNVIAIGLSAGFLEPLESTSIHLIQVGIAKLLELFPDKQCDLVLAARYNQHMTSAFESIRDFIVLHYTAGVRDDSAFWNDVRALSIPDSLKATMELFRESGRFIRDDNELFSRESWVAVMLGQGVLPLKYNPLVDSLELSRLANQAAVIKAEIQAAVDLMPLHQEHLRNCSRDDTQSP